MKYNTGFKCLMDKCPNTCCKGVIKLSVIDALRLNSVGINSFKWFFDVRTNYPYAIMSLNNGYCSLLSNSLCTIYDKESGLSVIKRLGLSLNAKPLICRAYPHLIFYPESGDVSLNSGCRGVSSQHWDYVIINDELRGVIHEVSVYRQLMRLLVSDKSLMDLALLVSNDSLLGVVKQLLGRVNVNNLERVTFT